VSSEWAQKINKETSMRFFKHFFAVLALMCATHAQADVQEGRDYSRLHKPQPVGTGKKIEVKEFFFYGCVHCYHLHGPLIAWKKKMSKNVELQFIPVVPSVNFEPMARTFYALEIMGNLEALDEALYEAWNVQNTDLSDRDKIVNFVAKKGVNRDKFIAAYESFAVSSKIRPELNSAMLDNYEVYANHGGTPAVVVDGKYLVRNRQEPKDTLEVLDKVIKMALMERSKR
jgi:thiol:disulfide interchange protein DsbA